MGGLLAAVPLVGGALGLGAEGGLLGGLGLGTAGAAGAAGAGAAGAGGLFSSGLGGFLKMAGPALFGVASVLTPDKTLKNLLGVGAAITGGANMLDQLGGGGGSNPMEVAGSTPATGAMVPPIPTTPPPNVPAVQSGGTNWFNQAQQGIKMGTTIKDLLGPQQQAKTLPEAPLVLPPQQPTMGAPANTQGTPFQYTPTAARISDLMFRRQ